MKDKRQSAILEIIKNNVICTQDDLQNALNSYGYNVTQSTVSRDMRELKLVKDHDEDGNYRYIAYGYAADEKYPVAHYREILEKSVKSVEYAVNNVVVKCYNGMASSVCVAIDTIYANRMLGSIAGDDTIFIITRDEKSAQLLAQEINNNK